MDAKESIIIVDDTLENLQLLSNMLNEQGYEVRVAVNGVVALQSIQAVPPDLILLDINMPQMDGYEVCKHLKSDLHTCEIPVIFMSALNDVLDKVKAFSIGGCDYITKPFQVEEVLARIENQLRNTRLKNQLALSEAQEREKAQKLAEALRKIQDVQVQINTEKMFMLGKVVSGIAYEISNPINFIFGNISHIHQYANDLVELVESYQKIFPIPPVEIQQKIEDSDIDFVKSDLPKVLHSMKIGSKRIADIISSLKQFSQQDESGFKAIDLHQAIDNTLMILQYRLKEKSYRPAIAVTKNYAKLPLVECLPGNLHQVFMNILTNGIDSLEARFANDALEVGNYSLSKIYPEIRINTELTDCNFVKITIEDNGKGIEEDILDQIFEPVSSPKSLDNTTGLGLSISHQIIVEKHKGKLTCSSVSKQKAKFVIELPIQQDYIKSSAITHFERGVIANKK